MMKFGILVSNPFLSCSRWLIAPTVIITVKWKPPSELHSKLEIIWGYEWLGSIPREACVLLLKKKKLLLNKTHWSVKSNEHDSHEKCETWFVGDSAVMRLGKDISGTFVWSEEREEEEEEEEHGNQRGCFSVFLHAFANPKKSRLTRVVEIFASFWIPFQPEAGYFQFWYMLHLLSSSI